MDETETQAQGDNGLARRVVLLKSCRGWTRQGLRHVSFRSIFDRPLPFAPISLFSTLKSLRLAPPATCVHGDRSARPCLCIRNPFVRCFSS